MSRPSMTTTNIHFIGGEKGGVGKSLMSRVLAQYLIDQQLPFLGFDTDRSHGALMRFYPATRRRCSVDQVRVARRDRRGRGRQPGRRILVDLAAQTHDPLVGGWTKPASSTWPTRWA